MPATEMIGSPTGKGIAKRLPAGARARRFYLIVLALACLAVVFTALQSYRAIDRELTDAAFSRRAAIVQLAAATLSEKFARLVDLAVSLATRVRFRDLVTEGKWAEAGRILRDVPRDFPFVERLFVADVEGTLMADVPELPGVRGSNFADRDWYQGVRREWRPYVSPVYVRAAAPRLEVFAVAAPIRSASGEVSGILVLQLRVESLLEWVKAIEIGPEGFVYFVDSRDQVAFHSKSPAGREVLDFSAAPVVQKLRRGERGVETAFDPFGREESVSAYAPVPGYGWGVVAHQPARTAFAARDLQLRRLLVAYSLTLLFFLSVIYLAVHAAVQRRRAEEDRRMKAELEQRVAERTAQLNESREQIRAVTETANDAVISADRNGDIVYFNQAASRIFGYAVDEAIGRPLTLLMPVRFQADHRAGLQRFLSGQPPTVVGKTVELAGRRKDGAEFPLELSLASWRTNAGVFFTGIIRDITDRKHFEQTLRQANSELESFSYSVSHDLRSPLRAVDGFSRILEEDYHDRLDDEGRRLLGVIRDNSRKMGQLIDDLLEFSRLGRKTLAPSLVDMQALAREVLAELRGAEEIRGRAVIGELPPAHGDAALLRQVWHNLLSNAVKFSGRSAQPLVEVTGSRNGGSSVYCVRDNGAGFDMEYYDKLFGVFQRLHGAEEFPGTGVGLAIVQRVVVRHGGRVWAEGKVNEGASFHFSLPGEVPHG